MKILSDFTSLTNISSATVVACVKDVLTGMNLSIQNCHGQCYDGAGNIVGAKKGKATEIQKIQPRAIFTHCYFLAFLATGCG